MDNDLSHALAQIEHHKAMLLKWEQYVSLRRELYSVGPTAPRGPVEQAPTRVVSRPRMPRHGAIAETRAAVYEILADVGGFVPGNDIIERLEARGISVGGQSPTSTLSARLSGDPKLIVARGKGYQLRESPEGDGAAGDASADVPATPVTTPNSADEDGRGVAHDNMSH